MLVEPLPDRAALGLDLIADGGPDRRVGALPAAVAVWSGWVQLGMMCGFGIVQPLLGIVPWHINTAVTLPVGTEAYAAFALGAWLHSATAERAKRFARNSTIGSLALGVSAQVSYHLLAASGATRAPWPVTVLVSSVPVVVLGFDAALSHLLRADEGIAADTSSAAPETHPEPLPETHSDAPVTALVSASTNAPPAERTSDAADAPKPEAPRRTSRTRARSTSGRTPETHYRDMLAVGELPSLQAIQRDFKVGAPKARTIRANLETRVKPKLAVVG